MSLAGNGGSKNLHKRANCSHPLEHFSCGQQCCLKGDSWGLTTIYNLHQASPFSPGEGGELGLSGQGQGCPRYQDKGQEASGKANGPLVVLAELSSDHVTLPLNLARKFLCHSINMLRTFLSFINLGGIKIEIHLPLHDSPNATRAGSEPG